MSATTARRVRARRPALRSRLTVTAILVVALVAGLVLAIVLPSGGRPHPSAAAVKRYEAAIIGPVKDWGSVEILGMRPSVRDLLGGKDTLPPAAVITESQAWLTAFAHDRELIAAVRPPTGLGPCRALLLRALDKYSEAARAFGAAAAIPLYRRRPAVEAAVGIATAGDALFDQASTVLQQARLDAGLELSPNFPKPSASPPAN
jgi:hypothetical protein